MAAASSVGTASLYDAAWFGVAEGAAHDDGAATVTALDVVLGSQALVGVRDRGARHLHLGGQHT
jgi:hypothetical protein